MNQDRWGNLTRLEVVIEPVMLPKLGGGSYDSGDRRELWKLHCDCGKDFTIDKENFPGRAVMRNCGPDCQYDLNGRVRSTLGRPPVYRVPGKSINSYIPGDIVEILEQLRGAGSFSSILVHVVRRGLEAMAQDEQAKAKQKEQEER